MLVVLGIEFTPSHMLGKHNVQLVLYISMFLPRKAMGLCSTGKCISPNAEKIGTEVLNAKESQNSSIKM